jgi:uncharacterized membrane protein
MAILKFLLLLTKNLALLGLAVIVIAKIFFPNKFEQAVVTPTRKMPVFGKVLGTTWETAKDLETIITDKTVQYADELETKDLNINETIDQISKSENPSQKISQLLEDSVNQKVDNLKDLPAETVEKVREQIRSEMYRQVCGQWLKEEENKNENNH